MRACHSKVVGDRIGGQNKIVEMARHMRVAWLRSACWKRGTRFPSNRTRIHEFDQAAAGQFAEAMGACLPRGLAWT